MKQSNADARPAWAHSASDPVQGYQPPFKDRPTLVIVASGGDFVTGMNRDRRDMATPYLREVLRFIGVTNVLCAERTNHVPALRIRGGTLQPRGTDGASEVAA